MPTPQTSPAQESKIVGSGAETKSSSEAKPYSPATFLCIEYKNFIHNLIGQNNFVAEDYLYQTWLKQTIQEGTSTQRDIAFYNSTIASLSKELRSCFTDSADLQKLQARLNKATKNNAKELNDFLAQHPKFKFQIILSFGSKAPTPFKDTKNFPDSISLQIAKSYEDHRRFVLHVVATTLKTPEIIEFLACLHTFYRLNMQSRLKTVDKSVHDFLEEIFTVGNLIISNNFELPDSNPATLYIESLKNLIFLIKSDDHFVYLNKLEHQPLLIYLLHNLPQLQILAERWVRAWNPPVVGYDLDLRFFSIPIQHTPSGLGDEIPSQVYTEPETLQCKT